MAGLSNGNNTLASKPRWASFSYGLATLSTNPDTLTPCRLLGFLLGGILFGARSGRLVSFLQRMRCQGFRLSILQLFRPPPNQKDLIVPGAHKVHYGFRKLCTFFGSMLSPTLDSVFNIWQAGVRPTLEVCRPLSFQQVLPNMRESKAASYILHYDMWIQAGGSSSRRCGSTSCQN